MFDNKASHSFNPALLRLAKVSHEVRPCMIFFITIRTGGFSVLLEVPLMQLANCEKHSKLFKAGMCHWCSALGMVAKVGHRLYSRMLVVIHIACFARLLSFCIASFSEPLFV